jgi:uncharacterized 2Fe-2S/4Fe-4S cluster protein (DUF4445 family)
VTEGSKTGSTVDAPATRVIDARGAAFGVAVDIGTTTMAGTLVDLRTREVRAAVTALNPQRVYGADVMSRVTAARQGASDSLRRLVRGEVEAMVLGLTSGAGLADRSTEIALVGNTTMVGLFLGKDVSPLAHAPYGGAFTDEIVVSATECGMPGLMATRVYVPPAISAFVGSDVVAGLIANDLDAREVTTLFMDLGTNAEMVLLAGEVTLAASAAAGPALEGASIERGMGAADGAIERVSLAGSVLELGVIGAARPLGICGSGLLDLVATLLRAGVLDSSGVLRGNVRTPLAQAVRERHDMRVFVVDEGADIVLTQRDVRHVQLALAAVRVGIELLLEQAALPIGDLREVVIGGGFGLHVDAQNLARLGVIPELWVDRVRFVGNAALAGAEMLLADSDARDRARVLPDTVKVLDLGAHATFQERFIRSLALGQHPG